MLLRGAEEARYPEMSVLMCWIRDTQQMMSDDESPIEVYTVTGKSSVMMIMVMTAMKYRDEARASWL